MRKQKKYHYIYKTTNLLSGKYYIGMHSTDKLGDGYIGSGTYLRRAINKHGKENFKKEIIEFVDTRELLKAREEEIVTLNEIAKIDCINLKVGGYGGFANEEHRKKCQRAGAIEMCKQNYARRKTDFEFNNYCIQRAKEGLLEYFKTHEGTFKGKSHSEKSKSKIDEINSKKQKGSNNSQYGTRWITNEIDNKKINKDDKIPNGWILGRKINK